MAQEHELKINPKFIQRILDGTKTFEIRKNDRDYQVGDTLIMRAYDEQIGWPDHGVYDTVVAKVVYFTTAYQQEGYCVLGIQVINTGDENESTTTDNGSREFVMGYHTGPVKGRTKSNR